MKQLIKPNLYRKAAFTIVELLVVIVVIAILVTITAVGFSQWRTRAASTEVKTDSTGVQAGMEDARNRMNGYPTFPIGTEFDGSNNGTKNIFVQNKNVRIMYARGNTASFCVDIKSKAVPSIYMYLDTAGGNTIAKNGTCDGGESYVQPLENQSVFVFDTSAPGCTGTVQLPVSTPSWPSPGTTIDWGDGTTEQLSSGLQSHTFAVAGPHIVTYDGPIYLALYTSANVTNAKCLTKVNQWGKNATPSWITFNNASNLVYVAAPPSSVASMSQMFSSATSFNQPISSWDMSNVTNTSYMFQNATAFNQPIGNWDTANVTNMSSMFAGANTFNQSISSWNTSKVTNTSYMFQNATAFNQPIGNWDTANVTNMSIMFSGAAAFNQSLSAWNTVKVTNMTGMFLSASAFNQPLASWNTANVTDMSNMFRYTAFNQPLASWNTANVTDMNNMFQGTTAFNQPLASWNTAKVANVTQMFHNANAFNQNISSWSVGAVTSKSAFHMFSPLTQANCPPTLW